MPTFNAPAEVVSCAFGSPSSTVTRVERDFISITIRIKEKETMKRSYEWVATAILTVLPLAQTQAGVWKNHSTTPAQRGLTILEDLKSNSVTLKSEADQFKMLTSEPLSDPDLYVPRLEALKAIINRMGRDLEMLEQEQDTLPSWQQDTIAETAPLLKVSASDAEQAIEYFDQNRTHLWTSVQYRQYAASLASASEKIEKTLSGHLTVAKLHNEEQRANDKLERVAGE
jgi:hypothetical protein